MVYRLLPSQMSVNAHSPSGGESEKIYCIVEVTLNRETKEEAACHPQQSHQLEQMRREQEALRARNADRPRGYKRLLPEKVKKTRGGGVLPIMAYTGRLRSKGVPSFRL